MVGGGAGGVLVVVWGAYWVLVGHCSGRHSAGNQGRTLFIAIGDNYVSCNKGTTEINRNRNVQLK